MKELISSISTNNLTQIILGILGICGISLYINFKVNKNKDKNIIKEINQKIDNGNNNYQSGRDINVQK